MLLLTVLTILLLLALVAVLVAGLTLIVRALEAIGNAPTSTPVSMLANIRWGVRAIETQTAAIGPQARRLNDGLEAMGGSVRRLRDDVEALRGRCESGG